MEADIPGKTNSYLCCVFGGKKEVRNSFTGNVAISLLCHIASWEYGANLVTSINFLLQTPNNE